MKKYILYTLIILLVFSSSCYESNKTNDKNNSQNIIYDEEVELYVLPYITGKKYHSDYSIVWTKFMKEQYNIDVKMLKLENIGENYLPWGFRDIYPGLIAENGNSVFIDSLFLNEYMNKHIIPLNEFLEESEKWNQLPVSIKDAYKDAEGNIWAIPHNDNLNIIGREIRNEWLNNLELEVPQTLDGLYNVLKQFTYNDPNQSNENDTYGAYIHEKNISLISFKDIFEANGCYLTYPFSGSEYSIEKISTRILPIGLNPESGEFENTIFNPNLESSLTYIKSMIDNKLVNIDKTYSSKERSLLRYSEEYGCNLQFIDLNNCDKATYSYAFAFTGENKKYTASVLGSAERVYMLSKNVDQELAKEAIPRFIDVFYGSLDGYVSGRYGAIDNIDNYLYENGKLEINESIYNEYNTNIQLVGNLSWYEDELNHDNDSNLSRQEIFNDDRLFLYNPTAMCNLPLMQDVLAGDSMSYYNVFSVKIMKVFESFINSEISTSDLIDEWKLLSKKHNLDNKIEKNSEKWIEN